MRSLLPLLFLSAGCSEYDLKTGAGSLPGDDTAAAPECALAPADYAVDIDAGCVLEVEPGGFTPVVEWQWAANAVYPGYDDIMATPAVANLTDDDGDGDIDEDDIPDIVFASFAGGAYTSAGTLTAISGDGSGLLWSVFSPGGYAIHSSSSVAIGDLDGDGSPEVCAAGLSVSVVCLDAGGNLRWAAGSQPYGYGCPALGDLDGDGVSEVVFGREVFAADGTLLAQGTGGTGRSLSFPLDVDGDGTPEIVAGNTLYAADGTLLWSDGTADGPSAAGDFDGDGLPELVHVGGGVVVLTGADGVVWWTAAIPGGGNGGAPTVADFDGDGQPEVGVAGATQYSVLDTDGSTLWSQPVQDASSNVTGSSVFDFEGDGKADVVYADELTLWVYDGATGAVKLEAADHASGTLYEYPLIVDVDNDGATEIVLASNNYAYAGWNGITVLGDASGTWRPSRPIWNQYAYHITNINDDGSIPAEQTPGWTLWNSFRAAAPSDRRTSDLADLRLGEPLLCTDTCTENRVQLAIPVENTGLAGAEAVDVVVRKDDGSLLTSTRLAIPAGAVGWVGPLNVTRGVWGAGITVQVDPSGAVEECDDANNTTTLTAWPCGSGD